MLQIQCLKEFKERRNDCNKTTRPRISQNIQRIARIPHSQIRSITIKSQTKQKKKVATRDTTKQKTLLWFF